MNRLASDSATPRRPLLGTVALVGVASVLLAWALSRATPGVATALDYLPFDVWLHARQAPVHPALVLVTRDSATDARFGSGPLDRGVLARTITALSRAGARIIGVDLPVSTARAANGGALGEAMLIEATRLSGVVVLPLTVQVTENPPAVEPVHRAWASPSEADLRRLPVMHAVAAPLPGFLQYPLNLGHYGTTPDPDGVARRLPVYGRIGTRAVPAWGTALATGYLDLSPSPISIASRRVTLGPGRSDEAGTRRLAIPTDGHGAMLLGGLGRAGLAAVPRHALIEVWEALETGRTAALQEWAADKLVIIATGDGGEDVGTPERLSVRTHLHVDAANTILTGAWLHQWSSPMSIGLALLFSALAAWWLLLSSGVVGLVMIGFAVLVYVGVAVFAVSTAGVILPVFVPLMALLASAASTLLWSHATSARRLIDMERRMGRVQQELAAVREELISRESAVERLEEDLEAARAAVSRSAGKERQLLDAADALRRDLAEAKGSETHSRTRLRTLEEELARMRAATGDDVGMKDEEDERARAECERLGILTREPAIIELFRHAKKAARSAIPVLLLGEPGTGKELFARAIHVLSPRSQGPFVAVNVAAIPADLFESEVFGHVKGAFTGAATTRRGHFQQAHRGTLFLDEIGDLRFDQQAKLLRVLQEQTIVPVGADQPTAVDVRIIAATNKDLEQGIREGWFREDLYFRLKGVVLRLPPLRERPQDMAALAHRLIAKAARDVGRPGLALSEEAVEALRAHRWPGNVRELQQCLGQAVALAEGPLLSKADLRLTQAPPSVDDKLRARAGEASDQEVLALLRQHRFDMQATARMLECDRSTITQRLKGLGFRAILDAGGDVTRAAQSLAGEPTLIPTVEYKLRDYYDHLLKSLEGFSSPEDAVSGSRRRFKNLPDRHFDSVAALIRQYFNARR